MCQDEIEIVKYGSTGKQDLLIQVTGSAVQAGSFLITGMIIGMTLLLTMHPPIKQA